MFDWIFEVIYRLLYLFFYVVYYDFIFNVFRIYEENRLLNFNFLDFYIMGFMELFYDIYVIRLYYIYLFFILNLSVYYKLK